MRKILNTFVLIAVATVLVTQGRVFAAGRSEVGAPDEATGAVKSPPQSSALGERALDEVTVIGKMDKHTLERQLKQFVESHAKPVASIGQVGRWYEAVCPVVTGLQPTYADFVTHQITNDARTVGAPAPAPGKKCRLNVEVVFTPEPQPLLDFIATKYRPLLGYYRKSDSKQALTFAHAVQAWYMTGTRSMNGYQPPVSGSGGGTDPTVGGNSPFNTDPKLDSEDTEGSGQTGLAGSRFTHGLRSEFVHVLILVDSEKVKKYPLQTVSDYIALLALTRIASSDSCTTLPSILNLFAADCATRPTAITFSDTAYLKGLYSAGLENNLNIEEAEIRDQMRASIATK